MHGLARARPGERMSFALLGEPVGVRGARQAQNGDVGFVFDRPLDQRQLGTIRHSASQRHAGAAGTILPQRRRAQSALSSSTRCF